jgi:hypothetical protein
VTDTRYPPVIFCMITPIGRISRETLRHTFWSLGANLILGQRKPFDNDSIRAHDDVDMRLEET